MSIYLSIYCILIKGDVSSKQYSFRKMSLKTFGNSGGGEGQREEEEKEGGKYHPIWK